MAVFQVENQLFRVPQCLLSRHSPFFHSMFSLPCGDGKVVEGKSEANPICLPGVKVLEFEALLLYLFDGMNDTFRLSQSSWIALLSIAHRYEFMNTHKRAIRELYGGLFRVPDSRPDDALLISAAEKYDVPLWLVVPTFVAFVVREEPLTEAEAALMSLGTVIRLAHARENLLRNNTTRKLPSKATAKRIVCHIWSLPQEEQSSFSFES